MKALETFFELSNYDSKNITNKGKVTLSNEVLNSIEAAGVTLEFLQGLNVPVYKYKTQITIHGSFPTLKNNYLGGYKNLFQNKNLSIGVKWQAVDYLKKDRIYKAITGYLSGWRTQHNSTDYFIYKTSETFRDKETHRTLLDAAKLELEHINKTLFFGNSGVYLSQTLYGSYYLVTYINIGGILESNVNACIENITKVSISEITAAAVAKETAYQAETAERKAAYEIESAAKQLIKLPLLESARAILINAGYTLTEKTPVKDGDIFIKIEANTEKNKFFFVAYKFSKAANQKKFRYIKAISSDLNFEFSTNSYDKQVTINSNFGGYISQVTPAPIPEHKKEQAAKVITGTVTLVNYSDKAIALFGDTKSIKEQLKSIGARFNPFLNNNGVKQAGWILPTSKTAQAQALIN